MALEDDVPLNWQPGQIIADLYQVEDMTSGGMGAVYFVKHLKWGIKLAVKTPLPQIVSNESAMRRFIKEAETWVNLGLHPNIASCHYVRMMGGIPRIFIEYVDGGSLKDWIIGLEGYSHKAPPLFPYLPPDNKVVREKRREKERIMKRHLSAGPSLFPMSKEILRTIGENLDLAIQICRGMQYVHEEGVIHRDLKPANCLVTKDGTIKVTDFGIAKIGDDIETISSLEMIQTGEESISITGSSFGTPEYMSPEQFVDAKRVGRGSDIYSFGVMLYEMVCGKKPFVMPGTMLPVAREIFYRNAHLYEKPVAPFTVWKECHRGLNNLVLKCLEKNQENRPKSFSEIEEELLRIYGEITGELYLRQKPDKIKLRADALNNKALSLLDLGHEKEADKCWEEALKHDPSHLAAIFNQGYSLWQKGMPYHYILEKPMYIIKHIHENNPDYWRYRAWLHYERGETEAIEVIQNSKHRITDPEFLKALNDPGRPLGRLIRTFGVLIKAVHNITFSPEGTRVLSGIDDGTLILWDVETGREIRQLTGHTDEVSSIAFSPDGQYVISGSHDNTLRLWEVETGREIRQFDGHNDAVISAAFSPTGECIFSIDSSSTVRMWETFTGKEMLLCEINDDYQRRFAFSANGKYLISIDDYNTIKLWGTPTGKELQRFEGHTGWVSSVSLSPDGKYVISGGSDNTLILWDVETGRKIRQLDGHTKSVESIAFSPDGKYVISGGRDYTLRLWDVVTGKKIGCFEGHEEPVVSVAFSPDGRYVLSGSDDGNLILCDAKTVRELRRFKKYAEVSFFDISPDGKYALSEGDDGFLRLWDVEVGEEIQLFEDHGGKAGHIYPSVDGKYALLESHDRHFNLLDVETGKEMRRFDRHKINSAAYSPDGKYVLSESDDGTFRLCNVKTGKEILPFYDLVYSVAFSPDGKYVLSGGNETLRLWDVETGRELICFQGHQDSVCSVAFSSDGRYVLSGSLDGTIEQWEARFSTKTFKEIHPYPVLSRIRSNAEFLWDLRKVKDLLASAKKCIEKDSFLEAYLFLRQIQVLSGHERDKEIVDLITQCGLNGNGRRRYIKSDWQSATFQKYSGVVKSVAFSPDGRYVLSGGGKNTPILWEVETGREIRQFDGHTKGVESVAFSPDGRYVLSGSLDRAIRLWDVETGKEIRCFKGHKGTVYSVAFSPDGRCVLSGSWDETLRLWDVETGKEIRCFEGHTGQVVSVAFSPDGRCVLSGSWDETLRLWDVETGKEIRQFIWDVETGKEIRQFKRYPKWVYSVAFSPDGRYVLSGSLDRAIRLWDVETAKEIRCFEGHTRHVVSVAFSPDGRCVLSGSWDETLRLWDAETGKEIRCFEEHTGGVTSVAFSSDGTYLLSSGSDTIRLRVIDWNWEFPDTINNYDRKPKL